ncbi:MAG: M23 family metallopeptidase [candidate division KSB1 bacterium]|nr:M23 family metallopeptidase [candidate division KSB1 bacterium]MDZ7275955.1 M23 family metallopeptidase [candidate division KSB1 bacterium]MDZ7285763.1 M23 family metallopeptidase [candidate division KSB1 bacterium]MDZ7298795.1 M23 family metallopeptidase [candidate division KSB1 bacterium]MDZ7307915.1 M23 family metallopeptidase [candidate division KSB1 bacterium]
MRMFWTLSLTVLAGAAWAQDYVWPTDASRYLTSAFGETRPRRFHAGIDVKTWNKTGYQAIATRSGYLERMVVSPFGYGRALYLRLDTGELAVYAHLERFNDTLQAIAERQQEAAGEFRIDVSFRPGMLPVKQGEVIGYTGDTGIGVPHLHFEIRDRHGRPTNPLSRNFPVLDQVAPTITAFAVIPLTPGALIDDNFLPKVYRPLHVNGRFVIPQPIRVAGRVGLAVAAFDRVSGVHNQFGVYRFQLFVDDSLQFESQFDRLSFDENKFIELVQDFALSQQGHGRLHRLFRDPANPLAIYTHLNAHAGALQAGPVAATLAGLSDSEGLLTPAFPAVETPGLGLGEHEFRVIAADYYGNARTLTGKLMVVPPFMISVTVREQQSNRMVCTVKSLSPPHEVKQVAAAVLVGGKQWRELGAVYPQVDPTDSSLAWEITGHEAAADAPAASANLPAPAGEPEVFVHHHGAPVVRFVATDQNGRSSLPFYLAAAAATEAAPLQFIVRKNFHPQFLHVDISATWPVQQPPVLTLTAGERVVTPRLLTPEANRYAAVVPLAAIAADSVTLEVSGGSVAGARAQWRERFANFAIRPQQTATLRAADGGLRVHFNAESVYWPVYGRIEVDPGSRGPLGAVYRVAPQEVPLDDGATIEISFPDSLPNPGQLGVATRSETGWQFLDNKLNLRERTVAAKVYRLGDFTLIRDDVPPVVIVRHPAPGGVVTDRRPKFVVTVDDSISGFASERSLVMRLDGVKVIAEYDPEAKQLRYRPKTGLTPGTHALVVEARDQCGNVTRREIQFTVR